MPSSAAALRLAPCSTRILAIDACRSSAAWCSGVIRLPSIASMIAPAFRMTAIASSQPDVTT
eukprot:4003207-Prymnesium_polylepis.2